MKSRNFKHGQHTYKAYCKKVGHGYEVGFTYKSKALFVGNFLYTKEANAWYTTMNKEIEKFSKRYWTTTKTPQTFYNKFVSTHLYKTYYTFLDKCFTKYNREYKTAFNKSERTYKQMKKTWDVKEKTYFRKAM